MDLGILRDWLIANGVSADELDNVTPAPIVLDVAGLQERTTGMQDIDAFTLGKTDTLEQRAAGMQDVDDFTLELVSGLQAQIDALTARIEQLEAGGGA